MARGSLGRASGICQLSKEVILSYVLSDRKICNNKYNCNKFVVISMRCKKYFPLKNRYFREGNIVNRPKQFCS